MKIDESVKTKLIAIADSLSKKMGELKLFACVWRSDLKKWDIIVSADWITHDKLKENLEVIFDAFKGGFNGEFALRFSGIYPLAVNAPFVQIITRLFSASSGVIELEDVQIEDIKIESMVLIISKSDIMQK